MGRVPLGERARALKTPEDVETFLREHRDCVLFKAGSCYRTEAALEAIEPILNGREALSIGLVRVVEARLASQRVAELTGVVHASPQVLLIRLGRVVHARDNWDISAQALSEALTEHFGAAVSR